MKLTKQILVTGSVVVGLYAAPALAAAEEHGAANPFAGDLGNAIWTLVIFGIVLLVLGKFLWKPVLNGLQSREEFIAKSLRDADAANKKAEQVLAEYQAQLDKARADATAIVEEGRRDAEAVKRTIQDEARQEAEAMITRAKREIGVARDTALNELYTVGAKLATDVAGKIISRELKPADHERLIQESIAELGRTDVSTN
ncbi:MAG TPA: F0F1 ATP synthase subunit B [Phycisphaerae bacterium]|nr:F0F1 ATP synthase subunit B [Phycisphaerales bacterium]HRX85306.1 F0F1 ATP synthase subunit B [Phycisphaerae bacterium]